MSVLSVLDETAEIKTIRVARPQGFEFDAGQFLTVRVRIDGREYARCYSISSAPHEAAYLEISVKRQGVVSSALHASARAGETLVIKAPAGAFRYPAHDDRPLVLIAAGIGITPLISMLRHAVATEPTRRVTLLYSARNEADFAFRNEVMAIAHRHSQVRVQFAVSGPLAGAPFHSLVYAGRIDEALLGTIPALAHSVACICGPVAMIDGTRALLEKLGLPRSQIRYEVFQAAIAASGAGRLSRRAAGAEPHQMTCTRSGKAIPIDPLQTLLEAADNAGVRIDSLCRAGVCGTCRVHVNGGDICCESLALEAEDREQGYVLACVSTAATDCSVEI